MMWQSFVDGSEKTRSRTVYALYAEDPLIILYPTGAGGGGGGVLTIRVSVGMRGGFDYSNPYVRPQMTSDQPIDPHFRRI